MQALSYIFINHHIHHEDEPWKSMNIPVTWGWQWSNLMTLGEFPRNDDSPQEDAEKWIAVLCTLETRKKSWSHGPRSYFKALKSGSQKPDNRHEDMWVVWVSWNVESSLNSMILTFFRVWNFLENAEVLRDDVPRRPISTVDWGGIGGKGQCSEQVVNGLLWIMLWSMSQLIFFIDFLR